MLVPGRKTRVVKNGVPRLERHSRPVDVPDDHACAGSKRAVKLSEACTDVLDVLEDLYADRAVEGPALNREGCGLAFAELDVVATGTAISCELEHRRAVVNAHHRSGRAYLLRKLEAIEAGSTTDVEEPLARRCGEGLADQPAPADCIADHVERLDAPGSVSIELKLAHRPPRLSR